MEIKHTIEILTKDIQDIENLIRNLQNYKNPPQIELDLAMSKLRRVYEVLYMISADRNVELSSMQLIDTAPSAKGDSDIAAKKEHKDEKTPASKTSENTQDSSSQDSSFHEESQMHENPEKEKEAISESEEQPHIEKAPDDREESRPSIDHNISEPPKNKESGILAEKFSKDTSLNEKIAGASEADLSNAIKGGPIDSIKRNIGINDRFLIIRELMNGDNEGFNQLILKLDECTNFNEAFKHIESRFPDHLEHEGVRILINLSRRKFISRGNV